MELYNYERRNAQQWDEESSISVAPSIAPAIPPGFSAPQTLLIDFGDATASDNENLSSQRQTLQTGANPYQRGFGQRDVNASSSGGSAVGATQQRVPDFAREVHNQRNSSKPSRLDYATRGGRRGHNGRRGLGHQGQPIKKPKAEWAVPPPLLTTPVQRDREIADWKKNLREKYHRPTEEDDEFSGNGYYLWQNKVDTPMVLLGWRLEDLDTVRLTHKVWIEWQESTRCLKISSKSPNRADHYIVAAIKGIRHSIQHANARAISASPQYIIVPPTASGMRAIVRPRTVGVKYATNIELAGGTLSEEEKAAWKEHRSIIVQCNWKKLNEQLVKSLLELSPYKGWMRMRVHFGHIAFTEFRQDFAESKGSFEKFDQMMRMSRTTAHLERKLEDATIATKLQQRILDWPIRFCPVSGMIEELNDVEYKDTEVVFITTPNGQCLRIEGDIDRILAGEKEEYQIGACRIFHNDQRNKLVEITMIDVEKQVDWSIEVITEGSIKESHPQLLAFIRGSVSAKSPACRDPLGLPYPSVSPKAPYGVEINSVVVRSVIQYKVKESGYIVEIAIYRTWDSDNVSAKPTMAASVSMYHPAWDWEMKSNEDNTKDRAWDRTLSQLLDNGNTPEACGLQALLSEVDVVQGFLSSTRLT